MPRDALRRGRTSLPHHAYHVTTCTHGRTALFHDPANARLVIAQMRALHDERLLESLAWVLMPDHLHWLFQLSAGVELSFVIKRLKGRSALALVRRSGESGAVWQRGFHDHAIRGDEDFQAIARYIVANPLRAGLVRRVGEYPWWDAVWL